MKKIIQKLLLSFPGFEPFCRTLTRSHVRCLMYHRFSVERVDDPRFVDPVTLKSQMKYICDHYTVIEPNQHLMALGGDAIGHCPVAVTVDDGYADFHDVAYPVFQEYRIPAMLFVTTGFVSGKTWFWWDKLAFIIQESSPMEYIVDVGAQDQTLDLSSDEGRSNSWHKIADRCRFMEDEKKDALLVNLADKLGVELPVNAPPQYAPVSWDKIRKMMRKGIRFGAHTVNHPILSRVSVSVAAKEMSASRKELEAEIATAIPLFAYPQGGPADFNDEIKKIATSEFDGSYVAYQDMDNLGDRFIMPRYCVTDDMTKFRWVLCGAEILGLKFRKFLRLRTGVGDSYWTGLEEEEGMHG